MPPPAFIWQVCSKYRCILFEPAYFYKMNF
ncbi:hypothetical protein X794_05985 [Dehalococcoides mccartyi CG5]|nr:hypothetical protein X794_05985 [Dehalococcoides mccartyi CG5]